MSEGNGGRRQPAGVGHKFKCPVCGKDKVTAGPPHFLGELVEPAAGQKLAVVPVICKNCKAITLVLSPEQPGIQPSE